MFWNKKKTVDVSLPEGQSDHRNAFRIAPDRTRPVILTLAGNSFRALNISGTGVCIRSHNLTLGRVTEGTIRLPSEDTVFSVAVKVVFKEKDLCRCVFTKIPPDAENQLHHYILELQKKYIALQNKGGAIL